MAPKMDQKPLKITSQIDLDFKRFFQRFSGRFFENLVPAGPQKTFKNHKFLKVFRFSNIFLLLVFSSFLDRFFVNFSAIFRSKIEEKSIQKVIKKMNDFLIDFFTDFRRFWHPFWSPGFPP